jgi:hypothetical protein
MALSQQIKVKRRTRVEQGGVTAPLFTHPWDQSAARAAMITLVRKIGTESCGLCGRVFYVGLCAGPVSRIVSHPLQLAALGCSADCGIAAACS